MDWEKFLEKCEHYGVKITKNANDGGFFLKQKNGSLEKIDIETLLEWDIPDLTTDGREITATIFKRRKEEEDV